MQTLKLGEIFKLKQGKHLPISELNKTGYSVFGANGKIGHYNEFMYENPMVLVSCRGAKCGAINLTEKNSWVTGNSIALVNLGKYEVETQYLYYVLTKTNFSNVISGSAQPQIIVSNLIDVKIPLPSLPQQKQIIQKLDKLTNLIELRKKSIQKTEELTKSIFIEMFGTLEGNEKRWITEKLNKIAKVGTGGTPSRKKENIYYNGDIYWAKTTEVKGNYIYHTEEKITTEAINDTNCKIYPIDTILLAMYGQGKTRGNVGLLKIESATNQACATIIKSDNINQLFLHYLLKFSYDYIRSFSRGGNQPNLNLNIVGNLDIIIPPITLQNKFATIVQKNEENIRKQKESLVKLEELYGASMQESFSF